MTKLKKICVECGRKTNPGSGLFINRVPVCDRPKENREMGRHFPNGAYKCDDCEQVSEMFRRLNDPDQKNKESVIRDIEADVRSFEKTEYVKELLKEINQWRSK